MYAPSSLFKCFLFLLCYWPLLLVKPFVALEPLHVGCPKNDTIQPCHCSTKPWAQRVNITCEGTNLAILSLLLKNVQVPIEILRIERLNANVLFGPVFEKLIGVQKLLVTNSGITKIDDQVLSPFKDGLVYLSLEGNRLRSIPTKLLSGLTNLTELNLASNGFDKVPAKAFEKLIKLRVLRLGNNSIAKVERNAFEGITKSLEELHLNDNRLNKLESSVYQNLKKLILLDLSGNRFSSFGKSDFNTFLGLWYLNLSRNQLAKLPRSAFVRNAQLRDLNLSYNRLTTVDSYLLKGVRFLRKLILTGNRIKTVARRAFQSITRLRVVDLAENEIVDVATDMFVNLQYLDKLNMSWNQVKTVSSASIQGMYQTYIDLSHNAISAIRDGAFRELANVTVLDLSHNNLTEISTGAFENTDVSVLLLQYNRLRDASRIPISNMPGLKMLNLSHNEIPELNRSSLSKNKLYEVNQIDLSHNHIVSVSGSIFEKFASIRALTLRHNRIAKIGYGAFGTLPTLLELDISHNNITSIVGGGLSSLVSVRTIFAHHNRIESMFQIPVALNFLHLEHNQIVELKGGNFPMINSLLYLNVDHNRIQHIEESAFSNLLTLQRLSLNHNNLSIVPTTALQSLRSLQYLSMSANRLTKLEPRQFGNLPVVFELSLDGNEIAQVNVSAFDGLLQLLKLNLSSNRLIELQPGAFKSLVSLHSLDLSYNQLSKLENRTHGLLDDLLSLRDLNLSHNSLSFINELSFPKSPYIPYQLKRLDLSHNYIPVLTRDFDDGLTKVEWLHLAHNIINEIRAEVLSNMTHLTYLDLSFNQLMKLNPGTLTKNLTNLTVLSLRENKLGSLPMSDILSLKKLKKLDVTNNRLTSVYPEMVQLLKKDISVNMSGNALYCNCHLKDFIIWLLSEETRRRWSSLTDWFSLTCAHPEPLKALTLSELSLELLGCGQSVSTAENDEYGHKGGVRIRLIQKNKRDISRARLLWFVASGDEDIAGFKLVVAKDSSSGPEPLQTIEIPYDQRSYLLTDLDARVNYHLCLSYTNSLGQEMSKGSGHCIRSASEKYTTYPRSWTSSSSSLHDSTCSFPFLLCLMLSLISILSK